MSEKGTDTAVTIVLNALETAKEWRSSIYVSSWDIRRAFDSLSRPYQIACLMRVGVDEDVARYLVEMDGGGRIAIKSPINERANLRKDWDEVEEEGFVFTAERGTGQGDPISPLIFLCCIDPLLVALEAVKEGDFITSGARKKKN